MSNQTKITFNLTGLDKLTKGISNEYRARVGILGDNAQRTEGGPLNNAELGVIQMFGSLTKNIPPRDFLFMPVQTHDREIVRAMSGSAVKAAMVAGDFKKVYALLGAKALEFVLMGFETAGFGQWAPNKPATIAAKGSDQPLIDTGQLRRAQTSDVVKKSDIP
jgi:hypothetical protein